MRCPKEGFAFWLVFGPAVLILCFCLAATCRGQSGAFTAPGGMYDVIDGRAVLNPGWGGQPAAGQPCCPSGQCPSQPQWQPQRPAVMQPQSPTANRVQVQVWTASWCGACQAMHGEIAELEREGEPVRVIDFDAHRDGAVARHVESLPTTIIYVDGREYRRIVGGATAASLRVIIRAARGATRLAVPHGRPGGFRQSRAAVCRIRNKLAGGVCYGSGTLVDRGGGYGLVVTAKHLFTDGAGEVTCTFADGRALPGRYVVDKNNNDLAAIIVPDPGVEPVTVAADPPKKGEFASSEGFGPAGEYAANQGFVERITGNQFILTGSARPGDSGGPVLDRDGRLIGVLWGTDGHEVVATSSVTADGFLERAGRYLLPYREGNDKRIGGIEGQIGNLQRQPQPLPLPSGPTVDLGPIQAEIDTLSKRQDVLEARQDKVRDTAEALAKKYEDKLPGLTADIQKAVGDSKDAKEGLAAAVADDGPKSLLGKLKSRLDERLGGVLETLPWLKYGLIGLAVGLAYLFLRKEGEKAAAGQPTLWQKVAAMTPTPLDDTIAAKVAAGQAALHERLASLHGTVASLAGSVSALAQNQQNQKQPPTTPAAGG